MGLIDPAQKGEGVMKKVSMIFAALFLIGIIGCSSIQINPSSEIATIQAAATVAGYEVGKNNPALITPILTHAQALLEASKGDAVNFQALFADALPLLVSVIKDPPVVAAIQGVATMIDIRTDITKLQTDKAKIQAAIQGFILGLQMAAPGEILSLRDELRIASEEAAREADLACVGVNQ